MKITQVGHAALLIEAGGVTVLTDPWWAGPCFGAQWWVYPRPHLQALEGRRIDYIYISHGHHDHFHPGTLSLLDKSAVVLVSSAVELADAVRELGFQVRELAPDEVCVLGDQGRLKARIVPTHGDDTLMALDDGVEVCINLNDALHSAPAAVQEQHIRQLKAWYPRIDYVFCGFGIASHFPNCYRIPGKQDRRTTERRQLHFTGQWVKIMQALQPRFAFPFAADVALLQHDLIWANEPTHNTLRPPAMLRQRHPDSAVQGIDSAPGFVIADGVVQSEVLQQALDLEELRTDMAIEIERANRVGGDSEGLIGDVVKDMQARLALCRERLLGCAADYRVRFAFLNSERSLLLSKRGQQLDLQLQDGTAATADDDLVYQTRWAYLRWTLRERYGHELLFVGSGGIFEYPSKAHARRQVHREIIDLLRGNTAPRMAEPSGLVHQAKQLVKRLIGRQEQDLYDLIQWTVFHEEGKSPGTPARAS